MAASEGGYQLADLLYQTYTATDAQQRQRVEEQLKLLAASPKAYALALFPLIAADNPTVTNDLKKSAAHQLKKTLSVACHDGSLSIEDRVEFAKQLLQALALGRLHRGVTETLGLCLDPLLDSNRYDPEARTCATVQKLIVASLAASDETSLVGLLKAVKAMFAGVTRFRFATEFYEEVKPQLLAVGQKALNAFHINPAVVEPIFEWSCALGSIIQYLDVNNSNYIKTVAADFQLADAFAQVLLAGSQGAGKGGLIWVDQGDTAVAVNEAKAELLSALSTILLFLTDNKKKMNEESGNFAKVISVVGVSVAPSPFVNAALQIVDELLLSALQVCALPNLQDALAIPSVNKTLTHTLNFLHKCVPEAPFYSAFSSTYKSIIVGISLPLIQCSPIEFTLIDSDPEEFHSLAMDICERQDIENLKTSASQLMEGLADNIDGALSFTVYYLGQLVEYTVGGSQRWEQFSALVEMANCGKVLQSRDDLRLDAALIGFCVLGYAIQKRADLKTLLHGVLEAHFETLSRSQYVLVHARLCLLVYFHFDTICYTEGMLKTAVRYLLHVLGASATPKVVHLPACMALSLAVTDYEDDPRLQSFIPLIISTMVSILPYQTNKDFFESLQNVIISNVSMVAEGLSPLLSGLVHKIKAETQDAERYHDKRKSHGLIVAKCWNVIRALLESTHVTVDHLRIAEQLLVPLFDLLLEPTKIDFEDDILVAAASIVKRNKAVTQLCWGVFERLRPVQEKYKGELRYIFPFLNAVIAHGFRDLVAKPGALAQLVEMCGVAINANFCGKVNEAASSQGAVLLQQLLLTCPGMLDSALRDIMDVTMKRYAQGCQQVFLKVRLLDTLLAAVNYNPPLAISTLQAMSPTGFSQLLSELVGLQDCFYHSYDKKLAVICLTQLFCLSPIPVEVANDMPILLEAAIRVISAAKPHETQTQTQREDSISDVFPDSDDDLPLEIDSKTRSEEAEAGLTVTTMLSPLQDFDETDLFRNALNSMYQRSQSDTAGLIGTLPQNAKKLLTDILQSRRVPLRSSAADSSALRKIVKVKRRLQK